VIDSPLRPIDYFVRTFCTFKLLFTLIICVRIGKSNKLSTNYFSDRAFRYL
jgi:hypothetical protein